MYKINKFLFGLFFLSISLITFGQEVIFFDEGTDNNFYDQGIVDKNNLGESTFEFTHPPNGPQWNDKVPCSTTAFKGATSLKFNYTSSDNGNWKVSIFRKGWSQVDISNLDSISFFIYSENAIPKSALPLIGLNCEGGSSELYATADYNNDIPASQWMQVKFPISVIKNQNPGLDFTRAKGVIFNQSEKNNTSRLVLIDEITAFKSVEFVLPVVDLKVKGYDSHADISWTKPDVGLSYRIYASFDNGENFELRNEVSENYYLDFVPEKGKNKTVIYRVVSVTQNKESEPVEETVQIRDFSDDELLDMVQEYSFRYFWEGAHQASGTALERSNGNGKTTASGATGFGLMAMIVAHEREYRPREEVKDRILKILDFLETCDRYYGAWSHWYDSDTKKTRPFSTKDNGGDLVETSFVAQALIALKHYFSENDSKSAQIREKSDKLWKEIDWSWYRRDNQNVLYWHWSPNYNWEMNVKITGWNECLVTYVMAAASPTYGIPKEVYTNGWARNGNMVFPGRKYYGYEINLARNWGGPLFWIHYSHHGIYPHGLVDQYADYWQEHVNTAKIHYEYGKDNPLGWLNYSDKNWGLTASDDPDGYMAHKPMDNDNGTVSPTAALASFPYTPEESMKALKYFYRERGSELFGKYGPYDAFNDSRNWIKESYIGIDQGPIVIMIENYRTKLLWKYVMMDEDVQAGLDKLGFQYEVITGSNEISKTDVLEVYPNPAQNRVFIKNGGFNSNHPVTIRVLALDGTIIKNIQFLQGESSFDCSFLKNGLYLLQIEKGNKICQNKLLIQK